MPPLRTGAQGPGGYAPGGGGAAGELGVDAHAMVTAAGYVEHVGSVMTGEVNRLMSNLSDLPGSWQGRASGAFQNAQERWVDAHRSIQRALDEIAGGLRNTSTLYDQAELDSQDGIARAVQGLPYQ